MRLVFYEKPGCINNAKQKKQLREAGYELDVRDLLNTAWSKDSLTPFLRDLPVSDWFNQSAPAVKCGEINPDQLSGSEALAKLIADPILIRRPLIQRGDEHQMGYEPKKITQWLGVNLDIDLETCPKSEKTLSCTPAEGQY